MFPVLNDLAVNINLDCGFFAAAPGTYKHFPFGFAPVIILKRSSDSCFKFFFRSTGFGYCAYIIQKSRMAKDIELLDFILIDRIVIGTPVKCFCYFTYSLAPAFGFSHLIPFPYAVRTHFCHGEELTQGTLGVSFCCFPVIRVRLTAKIFDCLFKHRNTFRTC